MSALAELDEVLCAFAVHVGFPEEREQLARRLLFEGVSTADVEVLGRHCEATLGDQPSAVRVLVSLLTDQPKRDERLVEAKRHREARARLHDRPFGDKPTQPGPLPDEPQAVWEHDRQCRAAWCRVHSDRRPKEAIAIELGVPVGAMDALMARGRVLCEPPQIDRRQIATSATAAKADSESQDRRVDFRERMRQDQARQAAVRKDRRYDRVQIEREQGKILAGIRESGTVDIARALRAPAIQGALAELEAAGHILRAGPPNALSQQPYRIAKDDAERAAFRQIAADADRAGWAKRPMR